MILGSLCAPDKGPLTGGALPSRATEEMSGWRGFGAMVISESYAMYMKGIETKG